MVFDRHARAGTYGFAAGAAAHWQEDRLPYEQSIIGEVLMDHALKSDPIHPNARGYKLIAERLAASLKASGAI